MADLLSSKATPTKHDTAVTSVSLDQSAARHLRAVKEGQLDFELLQDWFNSLLSSDGKDIFRMKGVLVVAHAQRRFVYHAVHMTFSGEFDEPWGADEARVSKLVFIGKNLNEKALVDAFNACLATPENMKKKAAALRFAIGDEVECMLGAWHRGTVVALVYRDDAMPEGMVAPYQIRLEHNDELIWAPADNECVVRSRHVRDEHRFRATDHVVCNIGGEHRWASGVVLAVNVDDADDPTGGAKLPYIVRLNPPNARNITVMEDDADSIRAEVCFGRRAQSLWFTLFCVPPQPVKAQRFGVGDRVACAIEDGEDNFITWAPGTVIGVNHRVENDAKVLLPQRDWEGDAGCVPYRVQLDAGGRVLVHQDDDWLVRDPAKALASLAEERCHGQHSHQHHTAGHEHGHTAGHEHGHTAGHEHDYTASHDHDHTAGHDHDHTAEGCSHAHDHGLSDHDDSRAHMHTH